MFKKKKREYDDDDGHVIANMNVEGMPWYRKEQQWDDKNTKAPRYSKEQTRYIILGTLKAALLIAGAFLGAFLIFILILCLAAWLKAH